ncbi:hypothetical protein ACIQZB_08695 [Streptomyces sp. NPDC097727]|uniref:hypothetical protein n=1 Tax=Streptomyces sp. NPDC097727 TaxID=3366092 RepID=UPI0038082533
MPSVSEVFASGVGRYFAFEFEFEFEYDQAMPMFQPVGGMDRIPAALTRAMGERRIRTGAAVTEIWHSLSEGPGAPALAPLNHAA